jgi:DNA-binding transcriptional LysR family regulator
LAGELHFGRTAERLGLTHARVSQVVASLEARTGTKLFDRTSRHVQLAPRGEELLHQVTPTYGAIERAYAELRELVSIVKGTLSLGIYAGAGGGPYLMETIKTFGLRHPQCRVQVTETGLAPEQFEWLRRGQLDLLIMRMPVNNPDLVIGPVLTTEDRVVLVAADHPLAGRTTVCIEDLGGTRPLIWRALPAS